MARGWDSKSVEDQQAGHPSAAAALGAPAAAEAEKQTRSKPALTIDERERLARRDGLVLARARMRKDLESAIDARYRAMLEQAIAHLDREIAGLE